MLAEPFRAVQDVERWWAVHEWSTNRVAPHSCIREGFADGGSWTVHEWGANTRITNRAAPYSCIRDGFEDGSS